MARGGKRQGRTGTAYAQRTDLNPLTPKPLPATAATGQPYGAAGAQLAAQAAVPMQASPSPGLGGQPGGPPGTPQPGGPPSLVLPEGAPRPGSLPPLDAPSVRPDEHLMTGASGGPGPGPESVPPGPLAAQPPANTQTTAAFLAHLASQPGAPSEIVALAQAATRFG